MYIPRIYSLFHHRKMRRNHDHFVSQSLNIVAFELHKFYRLLRNLLRCCVAGDDFFVEQKEVGAAVWKVLLICNTKHRLHLYFKDFHIFAFIIISYLFEIHIIPSSYLVNLEMALLATVTESEANLFEVQGRKKCLFLFFFSFLLLAANFRFKAMNGLLGNLPTVK